MIEIIRSIKFEMKVVQKKEIFLITECEKTENSNQYISDEYKYNMIFRISQLLCSKINQLIGAKTDINYRINQIEVIEDKIIIRFPIQKHSNETNIISNRIDTIKQYIKSIEWEKMNKSFLWLWRTLYQLEYKMISTLIYDDYSEKIDWTIDENIIKKYLPKVKKIKFEDNSLCKKIIDPLILDYGLFVNLSVPFNEMDYGYNYLHYYEHMMTYAWENLSQSYVKELNGATTCCGLCYIYSIHSTKKSLIEYLDNYMNFHQKTRDINFWNTLKPGLMLEQNRTISETINDKSMSNLGRSDPLSNKKYDTKILHYYSSKPFEIIIVSPEEIVIQKYKLQTTEVEKPKVINFNYFPIHVFRDKRDRKFEIRSKKELNESLNVVSGIDCYVKTKIDINELNTILNHLLLSDSKKLKKIIEKIPLPNSNLLYNLVSTMNSDVNFYLSMIEN